LGGLTALLAAALEFLIGDESFARRREKRPSAIESAVTSMNPGGRPRRSPSFTPAVF